MRTGSPQTEAGATNSFGYALTGAFGQCKLELQTLAVCKKVFLGVYNLWALAPCTCAMAASMRCAVWDVACEQMNL